MRKRFLFTSIIFLAVFVITSCGKKPIVSSNVYISKTVTTELPQFSGISVDADIDVVFTTGEQALSVYGADNVVEHVDLAVEGETLVVKYADGVVVVGDDNTTIYVSAPLLKTVIVNGAGEVSLAGETQNVAYTVNGSGDIDADKMLADTLTATVNGSGDIDCYARDVLVISRSGRGEISYQGPPTLLVQGNVRGVERDD